MDEQTQILVGVFTYRSSADHDRVERVEGELSAAGVNPDDIHMFVPPFASPEDAGNAAAGVHNAIQAFGVDRDTAVWCERRFRDGNIVLVVRPREHYAEVERIFERHGTRETVQAEAQPSHAHVARRPGPDVGTPLLKDRAETERHGRGLEPDVSPHDEPLARDYEREKDRVGW